MSMDFSWAVQSDGIRLYFQAVRSTGQLRTGLVAGDFTVTVVNPADTAVSTPAVSQLAQKSGTYTALVPAAFFGTHGVGDYSVTIEIDTNAGPSGAPNVRTAFGGLIRVVLRDFDDLGTLANQATILAALAIINADTDDIQGRLPATLSAGRMRSHVEVIDAGTITPAQAPNLDAAVSSRASQASLDSLRDAVIVNDLAAIAGSTTTEVRTGATQADDFFNDLVLIARNAAGAVARRISDYANTNGAFTIDPPLPFTPSAGDRVIVLGRTAGSAVNVGAIADAVWDELLAGHLGAGSTGEALNQARNAAVAVDARLPLDPADESNQLAAHAVTQVAVLTRAAPGDAMTLTPVERGAVGVAVRDTAIASSAAGSIGQTLQLLKGISAFANVRIDNFVYNGQGFLLSTRLRVFPTQALAAASTEGGAGEGEILAVTTSGLPTIAFPLQPKTVLGLLP